MFTNLNSQDDECSVYTCTVSIPLKRCYSMTGIEFHTAYQDFAQVGEDLTGFKY